MTFPVVDILGVAVELRTPARFTGTVARLLGDLACEREPDRALVLADGRAAGEEGLELVEDGAVVIDGVAEDVAVATLVWRLNAIATQVSSHLVLHAGAVADEGGGVLLPGSSGAGKSWLTAACVEGGFAYLSDEHAAVDLASGLLTPLAKPLDLGAQGLNAASDIRAGSVGVAVAPSAIVFPRYSRGTPTTWTPLAPAETLLALCAHCANLSRLGETGFRWLAGLAATCPAGQVSYSDAPGAVDLLRSMRADARSRQAQEGQRPPNRARPAAATASITSDTTTVMLDDEVVVLDHTTLATHHLNRSAALVWLCARGAPDRATLSKLVLAAAPPNAIHAEEIDATIAHLGRVGLLSVAR
ncbi:MAG: hypothetical protein WKF43_00205 [Acidimicrobiales bacterium]